MQCVKKPHVCTCDMVSVHIYTHHLHTNVHIFYRSDFIPNNQSRAEQLTFVRAADDESYSVNNIFSISGSGTDPGAHL